MRSGRDLFAPKLGLTIPLVSLHFVFFFLAVIDPSKTRAIFAFFPQRVLLAPWTVFTYQFLHSGPMALFFGALMLWILGSALEAEWGTKEFAAFWVVASAGGALSAFLLGTPLVSDPFIVPVSMLFAYATLFPDVQFLAFFVIPVKVKWLAWLALAMLLWGMVTDWSSRGLAPALVRAAGAAAGYLFFWVRHQGRFKARKAARQAIFAIKEAGVSHADETLEKRNRALFPEVQVLRDAARAGAELPAASSAARHKIEGLVVSGVHICKPVDFKGDQDLVCLRCEGFAECSLRYVAGAPKEIKVKPLE